MYIYFVASVTWPFSWNCVCIDCVRESDSSDLWFRFSVLLFCKSNLFLLPFLDFTCITNLSQRFQSDICLVCSHRFFQSALCYLNSLIELLFVVDHVAARCLCVQLVVINIFQFPGSCPPLTFRQWLWYYNVLPSSFDFLAFGIHPLEAMILLSDMNNRIAL